MMRRRRSLVPSEPDLDTARLLRLVKVGRDPKRAWSGGDLTITFAQAVNNAGICDSSVYRLFEAGYKLLGQTRFAAKMGRDELALLIGRDAVSLTPRLKTREGLDDFLSEVVAYAQLHGVAPDTRTLRKLVKGQELRRDVGKTLMLQENARLMSPVTPRKKRP